MKPTTQPAPKAKTNAERQRAYRQRHLKADDGEKARLEVMLDFHWKLTLERIAKHQGITQTEALERLIEEGNNRIKQAMTDEEKTAYFEAVKP